MYFVHINNLNFILTYILTLFYFVSYFPLSLWLIKQQTK